MATFPGKNWNTLRGIVTTTGVFTSVYRPGDAGETVDILFPDGRLGHVKTPALADWFLAAENAQLTVYYLRIVEGGHDLVRIATTIPCGGWAGELTTGGVGPVGPAGPVGPKGADGAQGSPGAPGATGPAGQGANVTEEQMQRIAYLSAEQVLLGAPASDHYGLPPNAQFGTRFQENLAIMLTNQAFLQEFVKSMDTAVLGLLNGGYQPQGG